MITLEFDGRVQAHEVSTARLLSEGLAREFSSAVSAGSPLASKHEIQARIDGVIARFGSFDRILVLDPQQQTLFDTRPQAAAPPLKEGIAAQTHSSHGSSPLAGIGPRDVVASNIATADGKLLGSVVLLVAPGEIEDYRWELLAVMALPTAGVTALAALLCLWPVRWLRHHIDQQFGAPRRILQSFVLGELQENQEGHQQAPSQTSQALVSAVVRRWQSLSVLQERIQHRVRR
jgi:hypothetical protein